MQNYMFEIDLFFELSGDAMTVSFEYETENPDDIVDNADWPEDFTATILQNISIVPHSYEEV